MLENCAFLLIMDYRPYLLQYVWLALDIKEGLELEKLSRRTADQTEAEVEAEVEVEVESHGIGGGGGSTNEKRLLRLLVEQQRPAVTYQTELELMLELERVREVFRGTMGVFDLGEAMDGLLLGDKCKDEGEGKGTGTGTGSEAARYAETHSYAQP